MARRYLKLCETIPEDALMVSPSGFIRTTNNAGWNLAPDDWPHYIEVPDTLPPEVIDLMTQIKSHITSAQQLLQTLETRLNTLETVP